MMEDLILGAVAGGFLWAAIMTDSWVPAILVWTGLLLIYLAPQGTLQ